MEPNDLSGRRPLKVRNASFATNLARWLSQRSITPNQISIGSILFAAVAAGALVLRASQSGVIEAVCLVVAALGIQGRLLCNLFDGMVAVEGGKKTPSGELYNDIPDRIADPLILVAAGYAIPQMDYAMTLGWLAALLAVLTAYVRVLGVSLGAPADFRGPMAKQQRMAALTVACLLSLFEPLFALHGQILWICLLVIATGSLVTLYRRTLGIHRFLVQRAHQEVQG